MEAAGRGGQACDEPRTRVGHPTNPPPEVATSLHLTSLLVLAMNSVSHL